MKICLLNVLHAPHDKRVFQKIARSLSGAGYEVVSIAQAESTPLPEAGVRFVAIPPAQGFAGRLRNVARLVRLGRKEAADVYLAPEPESWVAALCIKLTRRCRVIFDMHEHVPTEFAKFFPRPLQGLTEWLTVRFMRLFARFTDHIILTRGSFETPWRGLRTPRTVVINSNHVQPRCTQIPPAVRVLYGDDPAIIHQGIFGDVRGSWQLLDAMKLLVKEMPRLRCMILGDYVYGDEEAYRAAIVEAGLQENLLLLPKVPYDAVPPYIAAARVGLILFQPGPLNHTLAMPHKLFDYMREATPVIAPDFAVEVAAIVRDAECGLLVDVTDPAAIADAVLRLLKDEALAERLGQNGRRAVEDRYNWQREEQELLAIFEAWQGGSG